MPGRNSWVLPGSGILGGLALNAVPPDSTDMITESPWAQAVREAWERRLPDGTVSSTLGTGNQLPQSSFAAMGGPPFFPTSPSAVFPASALALGFSPSPPPAPQAGDSVQQSSDPSKAGSANLPDRFATSSGTIPVSYQEGATRPWWGLPLPDPWDFWRKGAIDSIRPFFQRGAGTGSRSRGGDDEDQCDARYSQERQRCWDRRPDMAHPDFLDGCLERAKERWLKCRENGYTGGPGEVPEWGDADEEIWRNFGR